MLRMVCWAHGWSAPTPSWSNRLSQAGNKTTGYATKFIYRGRIFCTISLLISKLLCRYKGLYVQMWGGGHGEPPSPLYPSQYLQICSNTHAHQTYCTEYRIHNPGTLVHKITDIHVFYMALGLNDFDVGKSITRVMRRGWLC